MKKLFNFRPINKWPKNKKVFDIISFVIFCPKHKQIAVNTYRSQNDFAVGLPFVHISSYIKIDPLIEDTICLILSDGDSELMAKYKEVLPFDRNVSEVLSLRLRQFKFGFTRYMCFVRLHSDNPGLKCCRTNSRIDWYSAKINEFNKIENRWKFWEPTIGAFVLHFSCCYIGMNRNAYKIIQDHTPNSGTYYSKFEQSNENLAILKSLNITEKDIHLFFIEFIEHCFPSVHLSWQSFHYFLHNLGIILPNYLIGVIMNFKRSSHLSFENFLIALICMDPHCPHSKSRLKLIYRYYKYVRRLKEKDLREMFEEIHRNDSIVVIDGMVADYMALKDISSNGLTYNDFEKGVISGTIEGTDRLFRLKFPLFRRIGCGRKRVGPNVLNDEYPASDILFKLKKQNIYI